MPAFSVKCFFLSIAWKALRIILPGSPLSTQCPTSRQEQWERRCVENHVLSSPCLSIACPSLPPDLFVGQLKSSLTCTDCGYCSTVFDPFWDLSLPIAKVCTPVDPLLKLHVYPFVPLTSLLFSLPARLSWGDFNGLHEALHQRGCAWWRWKACKSLLHNGF